MALPAPDGALRLAMPLSAVQQQISAIRYRILQGVAIAFLPAVLLAALRDATMLRVEPKALDRWLTPAAGHAVAEHLYLVDPLGNWMMRFPASLDVAGAAKAKRDLERVLRASASWDAAGR